MDKPRKSAPGSPPQKGPLCRVKVTPSPKQSDPSVPGQIDPSKRARSLVLGGFWIRFLFSSSDKRKPANTMSNKPIKMNRLRQIIRLHCQGTGIKTIYGMVGISRNRIKKYVRVWHTLGMTYEEFGARSDSLHRGRFFQANDIH